MNQYVLGTAVKCDGNFTDLAGVLIDPDVVRFRLRAPDGTLTTYVYGDDVEVVRETSGVYHVWVPTLQSGDYCYRFESEGYGQVANEADFSVDDSCFAVA